MHIRAFCTVISKSIFIPLNQKSREGKFFHGERKNHSIFKVALYSAIVFATLNGNNNVGIRRISVAHEAEGTN